MTARVVGFVFARGGSKGVPRKNMRLLRGRPLVAHAVETALASRRVGRVIVSTDDEEIAVCARQYGAEVPFLRPAELATDEASEWLAWQHAVSMMYDEMDTFVSIPPTAPLRLASDLDACINRLQETDADVVLTVTPARRNPFFNMVSLSEGGDAHLAVETDIPIMRRQEAPAMYDVTTVAYAARPDYILRAASMFVGRVSAVIVPQERALDIDSELDLRVAECLLSQRV